MDPDEAALRAPGRLAAAAHWYAQQGWAVFPLKPGTKIPATRNGFKDATTDPEQITAWWDATPQANVGLPTGAAFDVVDIDGNDGMASFDALEQAGAFADVPALGYVTTPRGWHVYVPPSGRGNKTALRPGLDYRGNGGYVVAPPSVVDGKLYRWAQPVVTA